MKIPQNLSQMLPAAYRPAPLAAKPSVLNQQSRFSGLASNAQQSQSQKAEPSFLFKYGGKDISTAGLLNVVG